MEARAGFGAHSEALVFLGCFTDFPDPRQRGKVIYPLEEVLLLCLLAVLAGAETFVDIARFGHPLAKVPRRADRPNVQGMRFCWRSVDLPSSAGSAGRTVPAAHGADGMMPRATVRNSAPSGQLVGSWMRMRARCSITRAPILIRRSRMVANSANASGSVCGIAARTPCINQNAAVWSASRT